jgi:hypothetical protein
LAKDHIANYFSGELHPNLLITKVPLPDEKVSNNCLDISTISCVTEVNYKAINDLLSHGPIAYLSGLFSFCLKLKLCHLSAIVLTCNMKSYNLDILQSISFPSFFYQVAMSMSSSYYQYIHSKQMLRFIISAVKGPIETSVMRYARSHTERLSFENVTEDSTQTIILYADVGTYISCWRSPLAHSDFRWMSKELSEF